LGAGEVVVGGMIKAGIADIEVSMEGRVVKFGLESGRDEEGAIGLRGREGNTGYGEF